MCLRGFPACRQGIIKGWRYCSTSTQKGVREMAMEIVLDLQRLDTPVDEDFFGSSSGSSVSGCCNNHHRVDS